jgi:glycine cleavage system aminomethyltransferase T
VAVFDQTSFSKYVVSGPGALDALQWLCAADVDVPVGHCVYTPMLNARGTYEADLTVTRDASDEFWLVSSSATTVRDLDWICRHAFDRVGSRVSASDATDGYAVLGVMGPRSRDLLSGLTDADLGDEGFPFATSRTVTLAGAPVRATRMTYVGELGWELTVPVEQALAVYDVIRSAGEPFGLVDAGYAAIESLRLEKGYRAFGRELTPDVTPIEAGLVFATALDRSPKDFLGRDALSAHRAALAGGGSRRRVVSLVAGDADLMLWGGELVLRGGRPVGQVTSAAWGETVGSCVGLAHVRHDGPVTGAWLAAGGFEIDAGGTRVPAGLSLRAPL